MSASSCRASFPAQTLTAYWLGELESAAEAGFEEHLFGCADCTARLEVLAQLSAGIGRLVREGEVAAILPAPFLDQLRETGVRVREYRVHAGGSVNCTIAPEDDLVLAHLHAPLHDVQRLDIVLHDVSAGSRHRIEDAPFDPGADEVLMLPNSVQLRDVARMTLHVTLLAVDSAGERAIGEYTFNHSACG